MRQLVVTADDFGYDPGTNAVIVELLAGGLISATTLISVSEHASDAVARLRKSGVAIAPAVHATLTLEEGEGPWRALSGPSSITDADGTFLADNTALQTVGSGEDVLNELAAQCDKTEKLLNPTWNAGSGSGEAGNAVGRLTPTRMDSHCGSLYGLEGRPYILEAMQVCAARALALRLPRDLTLYLGEKIPPDLAGLHDMAVRAADSLGIALPAAMVTNQQSAAEIGSYEALRDSYLAYLPRLPEGTSEMFLHPSEATEDMMARHPEWIKRVWELRFLRDPVFADALESEGIEVVPTW